MKKLLLLILPLFFLSSVKAYTLLPQQTQYVIAEPSSTINLIPPYLFDETAVNRFQDVGSYVPNSNLRTSYLIPVSPNTNYRFQYNPSTRAYIQFVGFTNDLSLRPGSLNATTSTYFDFNSGTYTYVAFVGSYTLSTDVDLFLYDLTNGSQDYVAYTPVASSGVVSDNVYSSFVNLYTDRISYLAEGFTTNPYLLAMVGIIFAFIVLELFIHILHLKGGTRK